MIDINGIEIKVGMKVKTTQPSGGILPPAPSVIGEVFKYKEELAIKYRKEYQIFDREILLDGKINEVQGEKKGACSPNPS